MADQPSPNARQKLASSAATTASGGAAGAVAQPSATATSGVSATGAAGTPTANTPTTGAAPTATTKTDTAKAGAAPASEKADKAAASQPADKSQPTEKKKSAAPADPAGDDRVGRFAWMTVVPSWLVSLLVHMSILLLLALIVEPVKLTKQLVDLVATDAPIGEQVDQIVTSDLPPGATDLGQTEGLADALIVSAEADGMDISTFNELPAAPGGPGEMTNIGLEASQVLDLGKALGGGGGAGGAANDSGLSGRGDASRKALALERGGSEGSENAVGLGLTWLAHHQNPDGSWSFNHRKGPCQGRCGNPGRLENGDIAATAIALLPFLGAGQTHLQGSYKKNVQAGLYYLVNRMHIGPDGGDLSYDQGVMYGHGLASIALCEAYGMTKDTGLAEPAQQAINFIVYAQDPVGGGWRYTPHQPGDTSVLGWQLMALKSAHMAYLNVPPKTIKGAVNFLNSVQAESGATYGYVNPGRGPATTAIGLLCRMYLGWKHDEPALERGVQLLGGQGPSDRNMYYNYYATQVMHHYEGEQWTKWNAKMRDYLVNSQIRAGHERGSWFLGGDHSAEQGGRLYTTSMATMTLEVYYRHLPIYRKDSTMSEFDE
jgi:hypothetical protein